MADGGNVALTRDDERLILEALRERWRLKREASALSNATLARKFGVSRDVIERLSRGKSWGRRGARPSGGPRAGTLYAKILNVLREGPSKGEDVARELHIDVHNAVAMLCQLERRAFVRSRPYYDQDRHVTVKLYGLPSHIARMVR